MNQLELHDIITLDNSTEYMILEKTKYLNRHYYLIAPIDSDEIPNMDQVKIVEQIQKDGYFMIDEETNKQTLQHLSKQFLNQLKEELKK